MADNAVSVTSLSIDDLARLLTRSGAKAIDAETLRQDIAAGAPVNADGTINLVHYAAWLVKECANGN